MSRRFMVFLCLALVASQGCAPKSVKTLALNTEKEKLSYSIGLTVGNNLKRQLTGVDADPEALTSGIKDVLAGAAPRMTDQEAQETIAAWQQKRMMEGKKEGEAFLADNKKKEGVITLPSGLQYKVITEGKGKMPKETDTVEVHYRGTLIDGNEFDSSYKRGQPAAFPLKGVVKGWTEALQLMKEGSKWQLFIPSELAYGERGRPGIPPNAVLIFELELISVGKKEEKK